MKRVQRHVSQLYCEDWGLGLNNQFVLRQNSNVWERGARDETQV